MRSSFFFLLLATPLTLVACGGATGTLPGSDPDSGGREDAGEDATPSPTYDAGEPLPDSGGGTDSGPDCDALLTQLNALQAKAQACCAQCDIVQCYTAVPGMCCPISVTEANGPTTQAFEAALTQYQQVCPYGCPAIACQQAPSGICGASGECE
jgi:hypothetical protein